MGFRDLLRKRNADERTVTMATHPHLVIVIYAEAAHNVSGTIYYVIPQPGCLDRNAGTHTKKEYG